MDDPPLAPPAPDPSKPPVAPVTAPGGRAKHRPRLSASAGAVMIAISCLTAFTITCTMGSLGHVEKQNQGPARFVPGDWRVGLLSGLLVAMVVGFVGQKTFQRLNRR